MNTGVARLRSGCVALAIVGWAGIGVTATVSHSDRSHSARSDGAASGIPLTATGPVPSAPSPPERDMAPDSAPGRGGQEPVAVSLGTINAVRGTTALVALALFPNGAEVGLVISDITFPQDLLSFEGTEATLPSEAGVTIATTVLPKSKSAPFGTLRLEIKSKDPLPDGALVKLKFKISPKTPGGALALKHTAQATTSDGQKIQPAAKDGRINVAEVAVYSCFFYMH